MNGDSKHSADVRFQGDDGKDVKGPGPADLDSHKASDKESGKKAGGTKRKRESRTRGFAFTLHAPEGCSDVDALRRFGEGTLSAAFVADGRIKSFQFQLEKAPTTGKLHFQGCMYFYRDTSLSIVHGVFGGLSPWVQPARNYKACWEYCQKDDTLVDKTCRWSHGPPPAQGRRTDLEDFLDDAKRFKSGDVDIHTMRESHAGIECRYLRYFDRIISRSSKQRSSKTRVVFIYGPPGTGKTTRARQLARDKYGHEPFPISLARSTGHVQFYDGYDQWETQKACLIDEFAYNRLPLADFNALGDEGPLKVRVHGGYVEWVTELLLITSNFDFSTCYPSCAGADVSALRRVDEIWEVSYHPDHQLDLLCTNARDCAVHAVWKQIK